MPDGKKRQREPVTLHIRTPRTLFPAGRPLCGRYYAIHGSCNEMVGNGIVLYFVTAPDLLLM
jgi:hypothetical protein